jgi:hypothetical protein
MERPGDHLSLTDNENKRPRSSIEEIFTRSDIKFDDELIIELDLIKLTIHDLDSNNKYLIGAGHQNHITQSIMNYKYSILNNENIKFYFQEKLYPYLQDKSLMRKTRKNNIEFIGRYQFFEPRTCKYLAVINEFPVMSSKGLYIYIVIQLFKLNLLINYYYHN